MNKDEGNFWFGLLLGRSLGNKKPNKFLSFIMSIVWLVLFFGILYYLFGSGGIVLLIAGYLTIVIFKIIKKQRIEKANEAWELFNNGNYTLALEKAEEIAEKNADAADLAGILYKNGEGCDIDLEKAFHYFELGQKKNMEAKALYADMLLTGTGCEQNVELGKKELIKAAAVGKNTYAIMKIGEFMLTGEYGFKKDISEAMKNLRIAADANFSEAKFFVGMIQYNGMEGVPQNKEKGLELIKFAAEAGLKDAQEFLAQINE